MTKQALYTIESSEDWSGTTYTLKIVDGLVTLETEDNKEELYLGDLDKALVVIKEALEALKEVKNGD